MRRHQSNPGPALVPDAVETTPAQVLTTLLSEFHSHTDPIKQRSFGSRFMNAAKSSLEVEYLKKGVEFFFPDYWADLYEEICALEETIGQFSFDGQRSQSQRICSKMARLIDDFLFRELMIVGLILPELAEERIEVRGKSGSGLGFRTPAKVSRRELDEIQRKRAVQEAEAK